MFPFGNCLVFPSPVLFLPFSPPFLRPRPRAPGRGEDRYDIADLTDRLGGPPRAALASGTDLIRLRGPPNAAPHRAAGPAADSLSSTPVRFSSFFPVVSHGVRNQSSIARFIISSQIA